MKPQDFIEHPEGGRFREVFRSQDIVTSSTGEIRSAMTHIYFSLDRGEISRFHRVLSDEIWNLYQGNGLLLHLWDGADTHPISVELSARENSFCYVVPSGWWQAAEPISDTVLVGCSVAPGFEFCDFELMEPDTADATILGAIAPHLTRFTKP